MRTTSLRAVPHRRKIDFDTKTALMGLFLLVVVAWNYPVHACELCCRQCGEHEATTKICRLVCDEKKISVTCWKCESEEICLPGPSKKMCTHQEVACEDPNGPCDPHYGRFCKYFIWSDWSPCNRGCQIRTKNRLMKRTVTKTVPSYKWVVEDLCPMCESQQQSVNVPQGVEIPPPPVIEDAKVIAVNKK